MTDMTDKDINAALMKSLVWDRQANSVESTVLVATTRRGADESIRDETRRSLPSIGLLSLPVRWDPSKKALCSAEPFLKFCPIKASTWGYRASNEPSR